MQEFEFPFGLDLIGLDSLRNRPPAVCELPLLGLVIQTVLPCIATFPARPAAAPSAAPPGKNRIALSTFPPASGAQQGKADLPPYARPRGNCAPPLFYQTEASTLFFPWRAPPRSVLFIHGQ